MIIAKNAGIANSFRITYGNRFQNPEQLLLGHIGNVKTRTNKKNGINTINILHTTIIASIAAILFLFSSINLYT